MSKKIKKAFWSLIPVAIFALSFVALAGNASAASTATLTAGTVSGLAGSDVFIPIDLTTDSTLGVSIVKFDLQYDPNLLTFPATTVDPNNVKLGTAITLNDNLNTLSYNVLAEEREDENGGVIPGIISITLIDVVTDNTDVVAPQLPAPGLIPSGQILKVKMKIKAEAVNGTTPITFIESENAVIDSVDQSIVSNLSINGAVNITDCTLTAAYWDPATTVDTPTNEGNTVTLNVLGENCDGKNIAFEVMAQEPLLVPDKLAKIQPVNAIFTAGKAAVTWVAEKNDNYTDAEYYFNATVVGSTATISSEGMANGLLYVAPLDTTAPITTATPAGGTYPFGQTVTVALSVDDATASTYYTTDGSEPTNTSNKYTVPIVINQSITILKFFSVDTDGNSEATKIETYTITPPACTYTYSAADWATVACQPDGTKTRTLVSALPVGCAGTPELTQACEYIPVDTTAPITTASPAAGTYTSTQTVTLTTNETATTYYTTNGKAPKVSTADKYTGTIIISENTTLRFFSVDTAGNTEAEQAKDYVINTVVADTTAPITTASLAAGTYNDVQTITLTVNEVADTYYTTDGTTPTEASTKYTTPITISTNTVLKFFSKDTAGNSEIVTTNRYAINTVVADTTAPITTVTVPAGTYAETKTVMFVKNEPASTTPTYYTVDGSTPTITSTQYTVPIIISQTTTLKFFSVDAAGNREDVKTVEYIISAGHVNQAPVLNPIGNKTVVAGTTLTFEVTATDPDGDSLIFTAEHINNNDNRGNFIPGTSTFSYAADAGAVATDIHFSVNDGSLWDSEDVTITVIPSNADTTPPTISQNLTATAISSAQINLQWAATDNVAVTGYEIWRDGLKIQTVGIASTPETYEDKGLVANTQYAYKIVAVDAAGNRTESATVSATTNRTYTIADFEALLSNWFSKKTNPSDLNNDQETNTRDMGIMMSNWGE